MGVGPMNRSERNTIRQATETIDTLTAKLAELSAERDRIKRQNAALRGVVTRERNARKGDVS